MLWTKRKPKTLTLPGLENTRLLESRDSGGFQFAAIVRSATSTVMFHVDNPSELTSEMVQAWERDICVDRTVVATECVAADGVTMAVTVEREDKEEKKDDGEVVTRLAATLPEFYLHPGIAATPMSEAEVRAAVEQRLGVKTLETWPALAALEVQEDIEHVSINGRALATFDVLTDEKIDEVLRELAISETAGIVRWTRIARPAVEGDDGDIARYSGLLSIVVPADNKEKLEAVAGEVFAMLTPAQRLRVQRVFARQGAAAVAGAGVGAFAWDAQACVAA